MSQNFGGTGLVHSAKTCVVYEVNSGRIHHVHHTVTLEGGQDPTEREIEAHARDFVSKRGVKSGNLNVIHVAHDAMQSGTLYTVDPKTRSLVMKRKV